MLEERDVTSFGISIGTGLTLETLFTPTAKRYDENRTIVSVNPETYSVHYFNIYTLARNMLSALTGVKDKGPIIKSKEFIMTLRDEIVTINSLYDGLNCKFGLYIPDNIRAKHKKYNNGKEKTLTKPFLEYSAIESAVKTLKPLLANLNIKIHTSIIKPSNNKVLLFDHFMVDFIDLNDNVYLLESHTGKIKPFNSLNSKYHAIGERDLNHLPFIDTLLYILGDKTLVVPLPITTRIALYDLSVECNWTTSTTKLKMMLDFNKSEVLKQGLRKYSL